VSIARITKLDEREFAEEPVAQVRLRTGLSAATFFTAREA
jgi:hypothetical protein